MAGWLILKNQCIEKLNENSGGRLEKFKTDVWYAMWVSMNNILDDGVHFRTRMYSAADKRYYQPIKNDSKHGLSGVQMESSF